MNQSHRIEQLIRFVRLFAMAFIATGVLAGGPIDRKAIVAALVGAAEVAYRQFKKVQPVDPTNQRSAA